MGDRCGECAYSSVFCAANKCARVISRIYILSQKGGTLPTDDLRKLMFFRRGKGGDCEFTGAKEFPL